MIGRLAGTFVAFGVALSAVSGIALLIALDFMGGETMLSALKWAVDPNRSFVQPVVKDIREEIPVLKDANDITFFAQAPVIGSPYSISTGVRFATPEDLGSGNVASRWCYITATSASSISRRIDLAEQEAGKAPQYDDLDRLPVSELAHFGMTSTALEALARSHCKFDFKAAGA